MTTAELTAQITKASEAPEAFHSFLAAVDFQRQSIKDEVKRMLSGLFARDADSLSALMLREVQKPGRAETEVNKLVIKAVVRIMERYFDGALEQGEELGAHITGEVEKQSVKKRLWNEGENRAADAVVRARHKGEDYLLVILRQAGDWALPGGFVDDNVSGRKAAAEASARELQEETGLALPKRVKQVYLGYYNNKYRDPRAEEDRWVTTRAFGYDFGAVDKLPEVSAEADPDKGARIAQWKPLKEVRAHELFSDHRRILNDYLAGKGLRRNAVAIKIDNKDVIVATLNMATRRYVVDCTELLSTLIFNKVAQKQAKSTLAEEMRTASGQTGRYFNAVTGTAQSYIFRVADAAMQEAFAFKDVQNKMRWVTFFTRSCPDCIDRHGQVKNYDEWEREGLPRSGQTVCRVHCHCVLVPDEYPVDIAEPVKRRESAREEQIPEPIYTRTEAETKIGLPLEKLYKLRSLHYYAKQAATDTEGKVALFDVEYDLRKNAEKLWPEMGKIIDDTVKHKMFDMPKDYEGNKKDYRRYVESTNVQLKHDKPTDLNDLLFIIDKAKNIIHRSDKVRNYVGMTMEQMEYLSNINIVAGFNSADVQRAYRQIKNSESALPKVEKHGKPAKSQGKSLLRRLFSFAR